jgi:hypothetical protein
MGVDIRPRTVWTGLTVPGKKMVTLISQMGGPYRGQLLIDLYKQPPEQAITTVAFALHEVPKQGSRYGPAFRSAPIRLSDTPIGYGTVLTDMRDFLKLRFRLKGEQPAPSQPLADAFREGNRDAIESAFEALPEDQAISGFGYLVGHLIGELDSLSRMDQDESLDVMESRVLRLRDLLRAWLRWMDHERYDEILDRAFDDTDAQP